jgi:hypothetical protein
MLLAPGVARGERETIVLSATDELGVTSAPLEAGVEYVITAVGVYTYNLELEEADAEWWEDNSVWYEDHPTLVQNHDVVIDDVEYDWLGTSDGVHFAEHTYSPSHVYKLLYVGEGVPIHLLIYDTLYGDNAGTLTVTIEKTPGVPAVSEWGMLAMVLLVLAAGSVVFMRRRVMRA